MIWKERYSDVLKTENDIAEMFPDGYSIENNVIKKVDVLVTGHFGNAVSVNMVCENICPFPLYNSTQNIGYILRALIELFDKENDDSVSISQLNNIPIRLVFDNKNIYIGKCIGIGHFMKDRFVLTEDLMKLSQ